MRPTSGDRRRGLLAVARIVATLALLGATLAWVDLRAVAARLAALDRGWLALGLLATLPMYLALAARWWWTARRLGAPLGYGRALTEYYLSTLLNQTLPAGIAGDAVRAIRHGRRLRAAGLADGIGRAIRVLVLDRLAGLAVLGAVVAIAGASYLGTSRPLAALGLGEAAAIGAALAAFGLIRARRLGGGALARLRADAARALLARGAWPVQAGLTLVALAALAAVFLAAGRAAGVALAPARVVQLVPLVLAAATLPLSFAGWGVREAVAALLFGALSLDPLDGATASVAFGLVTLAASAPGLAVALATSARSPASAAAATAAATTAEPATTPRADADAHARPAALAFSLAVLAAAGLARASGDPSWLGLVGAVAIAIAIGRQRPWRDPATLTAANLVTLVRLGGVAALPLVAGALDGAGLAAAALALVGLDAVDGWLARRTGQVTAVGGRLDMETDALLVLVLAVLLDLAAGIGDWILVAGAWRYAYGALLALIPARGEAPRSRFGRNVAGVVMVALASAFALGRLAAPVAAGATALLSISFLRGLAWSYRRPAAR